MPDLLAFSRRNHEVIGGPAAEEKAHRLITDVPHRFSMRGLGHYLHRVVDGAEERLVQKLSKVKRPLANARTSDVDGNGPRGTSTVARAASISSRAPRRGYVPISMRLVLSSKSVHAMPGT